MLVKKMTRLALLSSLCVALRYTFVAFPNVKPITAIFLVLAIGLGLWESLTVMSLTMFVTSFLMGFTPSLLGQIGSYALILTVWYVFCHPLSQISKKHSLFLETFFAATLAILYGFTISLYDSTLYAANFWIYWLRGLSFDGLHALSTACFYPVIHYIFRRTFKDEEIFF